MPDAKAGLDPAAITPLPGQEPFTVEPCIRDMLRTRFCPPGCIFIVEGINCISMSETGRWQTIRLLVGDGEFCIQALLGGEMHRFVESGELFVGCYVRAQRLRLKSRRMRDRASRKSTGKWMVYLELHDIVAVGRNDSYRALARSKETTSGKNKLVKEPENAIHAQGRPGHGPLKHQRMNTTAPDDDDDEDMVDAFEAFDTMAFPAPKPKSQTPKQEQRHPPRSPSKEPSANSKNVPVIHPRDWHDPQTPLRLTTLRSIPNLPYAQNWSCNILAVIASLSAVEPSHLPPYKQRTARIADPSTAKQVHLTVFLDPEQFAPAVGSVVLLVGVKNHRFDGGSLKKYASDGKGGGRWWFENPSELGWCDVAGVSRWWAEMEKSEGKET